MSATNSTTNYNLPIFIASDSPKWLVDWNGAMNTIDSAINTVATAASGATGDITALQSDLQTLSGTVTTQGTSISTLTTSLSTLTGTVNTITSLIGNGEPTTTDKTIIGAINELHSDIQHIVVSTDAEDITYDNTTSELTATNVQSAIDEVASEIENLKPVSASKRYIIISDSYGTQPDASNFAKVLQTKLSASNANYYNFAVDAMGFCEEGTGGLTALTCLQSHSTDVTSPETITDIICTVGINDITDNHMSAIDGAIVSFVNYCKATYVNATIHYAFIGNATAKSNILDAQVNRYFRIIPIICNKFASLGCNVMRGAENVMHDATNLSSDYVHPNSTGAEALAEFIFEYLVQGYAVYRKYYDFTNAAGASVLIDINGDQTTLNINSAGSANTGTLSNSFDLIDLDGSPIRGITPIEFYFLFSLVVGGNWTLVRSKIRNGKMTVFCGGLTGNYTEIGKEVIVLPTLCI